MTKTIRATFDGKTYVPNNPADVADIPIGTRAEVQIDAAVADGGKANKQRVLEAIRGKMSPEEAEARLKQLYADREADARLKQGKP